jgi:hypothetical protein
MTIKIFSVIIMRYMSNLKSVILWPWTDQFVISSANNKQQQSWCETIEDFYLSRPQFTERDSKRLKS